MSEAANMYQRSQTIRRQLLTTASAIALLSLAYSADAFASDDDADRPFLWIELGGQLNRVEDSQETFSPAVFDSRPSMFSSSAKFERPPLYSVDETGKLSFQPEGSDWVFSASVRFGRSVGTQKVNQQTYPKSFVTYTSSPGYRYAIKKHPMSARFARTIAKHDESHVIADFQVGKDVGLGMFGNKDSSSVFGLGVRFAQFNTKSNISLTSDPDWQFVYRSLDYPSLGIHRKTVAGQAFHSNIAGLLATRNFHGIGPSISWNASAPFIGNAKNGEVTVDWGLNAAFLFGRQRTKVQHNTTSLYHSKNMQTFNLGQNYRSREIVVSHSTAAHDRMRNVTVPDVGGFVGGSFRIENFKVSAGYRADLFFHAMDGGIDTRKSENVGFYGPFASVSVGLGG